MARISAVTLILLICNSVHSQSSTGMYVFTAILTNLCLLSGRYTIISVWVKNLTTYICINRFMC